MKKVSMLSAEVIMKEFDLTKKEVEGLTEEWYINTPGVVKINGEYYYEEDED